MSMPRIAIVFGSDSDWPVMENPDRVHEFARDAEKNSLEVIIAAAGMSNALAGAIAANTCLPVIGIPLVSGALQGLDALLSTVQMPPGIPVATVSVGDAGAKNAALLAIQIIARHDDRLADAYRSFKTDQAKAVAEKNKKLQKKLTS